MVCLVALLQAALNCCKHFAMPALAPVVLNLFIIAGAITAGLWISADPIVQVYFISGAILLAGVAEIVIQVPAMRRVGLEFHPAWDPMDEGLRRVWRLLGPVVFTVGLVQLNVYMDSVIANLLSPSEAGVTSFSVGPWTIAYPMKIGAASTLYYGPLIYNFPLGVFGIALATVIFPVLARYAVRKDLAGMTRTASQGLRLTLFIGIPSGVGIILVCEPLIRLMLNHGRFAQSPDAVARTTWVASLFALGLWSYSANHILIRTFYAMEKIRTPRRVAVMAAGLNFACNMILVWFMAEGGLALSTVISAAFQTIVLAMLLNRQCAGIEWRAIGASAAKTLAGLGRHGRRDVGRRLLGGAAPALAGVAAPRRPTFRGRPGRRRRLCRGGPLDEDARNCGTSSAATLTRNRPRRRESRNKSRPFACSGAASAIENV